MICKWMVDFDPYNGTWRVQLQDSGKEKVFRLRGMVFETKISTCVEKVKSKSGLYRGWLIVVGDLSIRDGVGTIK